MPVERGQAGFTLIELLCALVILALTVTVAMRSLSLSSNAVGKIDDTRQLIAIAESHLAALSTRTPLQPDDRAGEEGGYHWHDDVSPSTDPMFEGIDRRGYQAWVLDAEVTGPDGRSLHLQSTRLVRLPGGNG